LRHPLQRSQPAQFLALHDDDAMNDPANLEFTPETMRAMRIVKYLYENGIDADRLSGTSMYFTSSNRNEALANMKCTVTLEKLRDKVSLFEYHFGKKAE